MASLPPFPDDGFLMEVALGEVGDPHPAHALDAH